jgi:hypothetical protein
MTMERARRLFLFAAVLLGGAVASSAVAQTVRIPRTNVTLTAPPGFKISRNSPGLENPDDGSKITVAEYAPDSRAELVDVFSSPKTATARYASEGTRITRIEPLAVPAGSGTLAIGSQEIKGQEFTKYIAVLAGERTKYALITFSIGAGSSLRRADVDTVLRSVALERLPTLDEKLARLPFTFKVATPFRTVDVLGSGTALVATFDGTDQTGNKPIMMIGKAATSAAPSEARPTAEKMLRGMGGFADAQIKEQAAAAFAGGEGQFIAAVAGDRTILQYLRVLPGGSLIRLVARGDSAAIDELHETIAAIAASVELAQ